ncbi:hypothetical protein V6N11_035496 [Hibiscus sabdariffa]|uniref:Uncharacterized protein n=1 Tax=Hibiscus sabdariffa TaxID=183260 RepID=A0ABR2R0S6_9ROSI
MRNRLCCGPPLLSGGGPQSDSFVVVVHYGDVYWKPEVGPFTMKSVHQLKNDLDDCSKAEELEVVGEGVSDAVEKDANIEEPKTVAEDANFEESRDDAREHDAACNVEEADETIVEDANDTIHDASCNVEEADETIVEDENEHDANDIIHDAHDTTPENIVEEDACSNEVGENTIYGDVEPEMVEEGESEMNEEEEDVNSRFF